MSDLTSGFASLAEAMGTGHTTALEALRDRLAVEIDKPTTSAAEIASLSRQLVDVLARLAAIKPPTTSKGDDIAKQRAKRRGDATGSPDAAPVERSGG